MAIKNKLIERIELRKVMLQNRDKKYVFTNGCFDLLHLGHASYLEEARSLGDYLIVGLNSDESVVRLKGPKRPIVNQNERALLLSSLYFIDHIVIFEEDTPIETLECLQPHIHCKGGDYSIDKLIERDTILSYGGEIKILSLLPDHSSTNIINKIIKAYS